MKRQTGFTMVEIMVALALSLLLILGISNVFVGNRETYRVQAGLAGLQENARYAMEALRRDFSMAGFPNDYTPAFVPFDPDKTKDSGNATADSVAVVYLSERDCAGTAIAPTLETRWYRVVKDGVTNTSGLYCNDTLIVDGVENLQLQYGIDLPTGGDTGTEYDHAPNSYVTADKVTDWSHVVAIRYALLLNSVEPVSREPDEATFVLLDAPEIPKAGDMLRRRVFFGTVTVRNKALSS